MVTNTNTKNEPYQVNGFSKGMDTDTSDALISTESYRLAKNLRYITDVDENTGELRLIEGAKFINTLKENITLKEGSNELKLLAFNDVRNIGAVICEDEYHNWAVYRIEDIDNTLTFTKIFGWCTERIGYNEKTGKSTKISTVLKWEDADQLLLYIADGQHPLMKINVFDTTGSSDIKYISTKILEVTLNNIEISDILEGGRLTSGLVQYSYQLYNNNNISTQLSTTSRLVAIGNIDDSTGARGLENQVTSKIGLGLKVKVEDEVAQSYNKIQIYRISYTVLGQNPTIGLIYEGNYERDDNKYFSYNDLGLSDLQQLTSEEFNTVSGITIIPKVIEQKNNVLFAGNISYEIDYLDEELLNADFRAFSSGDHVSLDNIPTSNVINDNLDFLQDYEESSWHDIADDRIDKIGGTGEYITWKLNFDEANRDLMSYPDNRYANHELLKVINGESGIKYVSRGLAHDEIYRYGIILYSKSGIKYPVKWIVDIRTPNLTSNPQNYFQTLFTTLNYVDSSVVMYPQFALTKDLSDKISGYEIVRCIRHAKDMATISQGVIAATVKTNGEKYLSSSGVPFIDHTLYCNGSRDTSDNAETFTTTFGDRDPDTGELTGGNTIAETNISVVQFYSPESVYLQDDLILLMKTDKNLYLLVLYPLVPKLHNNVSIDDYDVNVNDIYNTFPISRRVEYKVLPDTETSWFTDVRLTSQMYGNADLQYKPFIRGNSRLRNKWYEARLFRRHFFSPTADNFDYNEVLTNLLGLNVYKFNRIRMPEQIKPTSQLDYKNPIIKFDIADFNKVEAVDWNALITDESFNGRNYQSAIGDYSFFHCVAPYIISDTKGEFSIGQLKTNANANRFRDELIATCDPSLILKCEGIDANYSIVSYYYRDSISQPERGNPETGQDEYSILCNLRRNIIPYGGFDKQARNNSTYVQHGVYTKNTGPVNNTLLYITADDGDTTVSAFEFVTAHKWDSALSKSGRSTVVCQTIVESTIDIGLDSGEKYSNNTKSNPSLVQVNPCDFNNQYIQKKPSYVYNTAYSIDPQLLLNTNTYKAKEESLNNFDHRVHYSNPASDNQALDPWLVFQPLNYLDVDSKYGPITNLRTFKNELVFWQEKATGVLSVNERVQIATDSNLPITLGTGGILERYDYLTTANGMKADQHADTLSDNTLYWWDFDNNTICAYSRGYAVVQLSKTKQVQNILNKAAKNNSLIDTDLTNSQWPLLIYDNKYNEVLFKLGKLGDTENVNSIVYNELQSQFISTYDIDPSAYFKFKLNLLLLDSELNKFGIYQWNTVNDKSPIVSEGFQEKLLFPYIKYLINNHSSQVKVYDNVEFAGTIPNSDIWDKDSNKASTLTKDIQTKGIHFEFNTPLKQTGKIDGTKITNRQLDFKFAVPRCGENKDGNWVTKEYGDRLRGKTMQCEMSSTSNSLNFSLQYIITKYRISWS